MEGLTTPQDTGEGSDASLDDFLPLIEAIGITVRNPITGHIQCPGEDLHTHSTAANHCTIHNNDGVLRIHCFHQSCRQVIEKFNSVLWKHTEPKAAGYQAVPKVPVSSIHGSPAKLQQQKTATALSKILELFPWTYDDIINDPVGKVTDAEPLHYLLLLSLFPPDDIVWVAWSVLHSGYPNNAPNFRPAGAWIEEAQCPGAYICPHAFKPGVISRCNANVLNKRFLVVESDSLSKDKMGAVFRYLMALGYKLRAIVDTAGKSLHGWFNHPGDMEYKRLARELPSLGCDPQMFSTSQPVRLPGALRDGLYQKLIYLNP